MICTIKCQITIFPTEQEFLPQAAVDTCEDTRFIELAPEIEVDFDDEPTIDSPIIVEHFVCAHVNIGLGYCIFISLIHCG